jgi:hypothetical protein
MKTRALLGVVIGFGAVSVSTGAWADEGSDPNAKDYAYVFKDDALQAGTGDGSTPRIVVLKSAQRARLLTPRINFVPELLKAVENM